MKIIKSFPVELPKSRSASIEGLLNKIRRGKNPPDYIDHHVNDDTIPAHPDDFGIHFITLVSFDRIVLPRENVVDMLHEEGWVPVRARPLLALRAQHPETHFGLPIAAVGQPIHIDKMERVVTINRSNAHGVGLRVTSGGWSDFWTFAVKPLPGRLTRPKASPFLAAEVKVRKFETEPA